MVHPPTGTPETNVVKAPPPIYKPPPTDALMWFIGLTMQPANPIFFSSNAEAQACLDRLKTNNVIPASANIVDNPWALGPVMYGHDGRRVWCIEFTQDGANFSEPVGRILWMEATYPNKRLYADPAQSGITFRTSD